MARTMGAPSTMNACQAQVFAPANAITGTTIERPTRMPAMKLPARRNLLKAFFIITSIQPILAACARTVGALARLQRNKTRLPSCALRDQIFQSP